MLPANVPETIKKEEPIYPLAGAHREHGVSLNKFQINVFIIHILIMLSSPIMVINPPGPDWFGSGARQRKREKAH